MPHALVGRDAELASLRDFVSAIDGGARMLAFEGEAGMGKTTLWSAGVVDATESGHLVLQARPSESEAELSFAGLGDLFDGVLDDVLGSLQPAQRRALSRALLLADDEGPPPDPHAIGVAVQSALRTLAATRSTVVAIDDVQWFDSASAAALAYACRRCRTERIGILLTRRSGLGSGLVDELRRSLAADDVAVVEVGPLDTGALHRAIRDQLGTTLPRPLLAEVHQAAGGNPFYALEITRMLQRTHTSIEAGRPLPVPDSLHDLVHGRLLALPPESRQFLVAAAAHAHPTILITEKTSGVERGVGLTPALEARIVETEGDRIRFTHPLLAAGALETADPLRRAETHARLAELLEDPEARAWQLAASVDEPDEAVAAIIEGAADHARRRGAPRPAALLLDCAEQLTPAASQNDAVRRAVEAAYLHFEAGDARRAEAKLHEVVAPLEPGPLRAKALVVLARIRLYERPDEARTLFLQVLDEAEDDRHTRAIAHEGVAACSVWGFERFDEALEHTETALALAAEVGDEALSADVLLSRLTAETLLGLPTAAATAERALAVQSSAADLRVMDQPLISLAENWLWIDEHTLAREAIFELMGRARETGDENGQPWLLCLLGEVERSSGDLAAALQHAHEGQDAAEQSGQPLFRGLSLALESMVQAQMGHAVEATVAARMAREASTDRYVALVTSAALGHLALALGTAEEAVTQLESSIAFLRDQRIVEPGVARFVTDQVEALSDVERREDAETLLDWYEGNARRLRRISALANCERCRGLLAARAGDLDAALAGYNEALAWHAQVDIPLDRGRTLLALGATQRRMKRRREARETLEEALVVFEHIGASLWAERTRAELARISGRAATPGALTPAEARVAELVAAGKTNREVAAALFLSDRTVEGHLTHVFGKLGIRHRSEVGPALAARQTPGIEVSNTGDSPVSAGPAAP